MLLGLQREHMPTLVREQEKKQLREMVETLRDRKKEAVRALTQSGFRVPDKAALLKLLHEAHHPHP